MSGPSITQGEWRDFALFLLAAGLLVLGALWVFSHWESEGFEIMRYSISSTPLPP